MGWNDHVLVWTWSGLPLDSAMDWSVNELADHELVWQWIGFTMGWAGPGQVWS